MSFIVSHAPSFQIQFQFSFILICTFNTFLPNPSVLLHSEGLPYSLLSTKKFSIMSFKCDDVSSIDVSKETWTIVVKVIRMWLSSCFRGSKLPNSMELVLMDDKGCKIHASASVRRTLVYKFKHQFSEGCVYQISFLVCVRMWGIFGQIRIQSSSILKCILLLGLLLGA